jgi:hypothetical protein
MTTVPPFAPAWANGRPAPDEADASAWNRAFDAWASPQCWPLDISPYHVLAGAAFATGLSVAIGLALWSDLPLIAVATMVLASIVAVLAGQRVRAFLPVSRGHVLAQDLLLALGAVVLATWAIGVDTAPSMDLYVVAGGAMLVMGRLGCLAAGCCHGRPCAWGIRYGPESVVSDALLGVRLFPIQLVESGWCAAITIVAAIFLLAGAPPGTATWWWLLAYACGRFIIEFGRGDPARRHYGSLSEAQWISMVILVAGIAAQEVASPHPRAWPVLGGLVLVTAIGAVAHRRRIANGADGFLALDPPAWREALDRLEDAARRHAPAPTAATLAAATVSLEILPADGGAELHCYVLSAPAGTLDDDNVWPFVGWALQRAPEHRLLRASFDESGGFHVWVLVIDPRGQRGSVGEDLDAVVALRALAFARAARRMAADGSVMSTAA